MHDRNCIVSTDLDPQELAEIESKMVRCSECSQVKCATITAKTAPRLRWCSNYTKGAKRGCHGKKG